VWFSLYRCRRIELGEPTGEILPACPGLEFEFADCELQPLPPRYAIVFTRNEPTDAAATVIDLVDSASARTQLSAAEGPTHLPAIGTALRRLLPMRGGIK